MSWTARNHTATSFLRNTILVCRSANTDHNTALCISDYLETSEITDSMILPQNAPYSNRLLTGLRPVLLESSPDFQGPASWIWGGDPGTRNGYNGKGGKRNGGKEEGGGREGNGREQTCRDKVPNPAALLLSYRTSSPVGYS